MSKLSDYLEQTDYGKATLDTLKPYVGILSASNSNCEGLDSGSFSLTQVSCDNGVLMAQYEKILGAAVFD
jgi:hypothetical protein